MLSMKSRSDSIGEKTTFHVMARCTNNEFLFRLNEDFERYKFILGLAKKHFQFDLNNYIIMNNHVHLMIMVHHQEELSRIMRWLNGIYSKDYNQRHGRKSHFWRARYRAKVILDDRYALGCLRYQHRNPLRAHMVKEASEWPWSGYKHYGSNKPDPLITTHPSFLMLSEDPKRRCEIYRELVSLRLPYDHREKEVFSWPKQGRPGQVPQKRELMEAIVLPTLDLIFSRKK